MSAARAAISPAGAPDEGGGAPRHRRRDLRRVAALLRAELPIVAGGTVLLLVAVAASLVYPQGVRLVVDGAVMRSDPTLVRRAALGMALVAVVQGLAVAGRYLAFSLAGERGVARVRKQVFENVLAQEVAFFDAARTGELTSRLAGDTALLHGLLSSAISVALRHALQVAGALALLVALSPRLTGLMLLVVPPVAIGGVLYGRRLRDLSRQMQDALGEASQVAEESLAGLRTVRAFSAEPREVARYGEAVDRSYAVARQRSYAGAAFMAGATAGVYLAAAVVIGYGGYLVAVGRMTPGQLTSFLVYTLMIALALSSLADLWGDVMRALGAAERVFELADRAPAIPLTGGARPAAVQGRVALERVSFVYPSRPDAPVLSEVDLALAPGERVALVGPSGAGKSTVAALVCRLYDPIRGRVLLDGRDVRELDPSWLRQQIGVVSQEPVLFSESILENIRYGRPGAGEDEVVEAAGAAHAHEFVTRLPDGYRTRVGERGVQLSGGQRQRIAIARALLKRPAILLLDEATSALDAESEHLVQEALEVLMVGRTTLIIAHRLSTVARADRVVVLDHGRVVESGTHADLMAADGLYRRLVERQVVQA